MRDADASSRVQFVDFNDEHLMVAYMSHLPEKYQDVYLNDKHYTVFSIEYRLSTLDFEGRVTRNEARVTVRIMLDEVPGQEE